MKPPPMPALVDQGLGRTDYVAYWEDQARLHATERGWQLDVAAANAALCAAFGREWLETEARRPERLPMVGTPGKHPLGQMLALTSAPNAARVLELGVYLKRCADIPRFVEVTAHLRSEAQFEGARLQLALGYRFRRAGCSNVEFEPDADRGRKADIAFDHEAVTHLVECYAPVVPNYPEYDLLMSKGITPIFEAAAKREKRVVARIALESAAKVDVDMRRRIEATFMRLVGQLTPRGRQIAEEPGFTLELFDTSGAEAELVRQIAWSFQDWGAWIVTERFVRPSQLAHVHRTGQLDALARSWIVVTRGDAGVELEGLMARLADSVEQKVSQVRREGAMGVIAVQSPIAGFALRGDKAALETIDRVKTKVLGGHQRIAGLWFVDDATDEQHRPTVGGVILSKASSSAFGRLAERLQSREKTADVLDDPEIV